MRSTSKAPKSEKNIYDSIYNCHPADIPCDLESRAYPFNESPVASTAMNKVDTQKLNEVEKLKETFGSKLTLDPSKECISTNEPTRFNSKRHDLILLDSIQSPKSPLQFLRNPRNSRKEHSNGSQHWKTATDPKSGRTYYYNSVTKSTQWGKPIELTSSAERLRISSKEQKQRQFFAAMEKNILKCLAHGAIPGTTPSPKSLPGKSGPEIPKLRRTTLSRPSTISVRTISAMNDNVLQELLHVDEPSPTNVIEASDPNSQIFFSDDNYYSPISSTKKNADYQDDNFLQTWLQNGTKSPPKRVSSVGNSTWVPAQHRDSVESLERKEAEALAEVKRVALAMTQNLHNESDHESQAQNKTLKKPSMKQRRNTCGTLYVGETMSAPDKEAAIKCVCAVYRAHILQYIKDAENEESSTHSEEYEVFNDFKVIPTCMNKGERRSLSIMDREYSDDSLFSKSFSVECDVPSLEEISFFYRSIFLTSKMESDCIIISLIYVEKIMRATNNGVRPTVDNWRSLLFSSMIMASKVWDDLSMWNVDFTEACPEGVTFSLQRINELEMAVLNCLNFKVKVLASEYAKYYFLLRSMLIQSGLGGDDFFTCGPLDMEGAKKLEQASATYRLDEHSPSGTYRRAKSMGDSVLRQEILSSEKSGKVRVSNRAVLEHVVQM